MDDDLWQKLIDTKAIEAGWHLVRAESPHDFEDQSFHIQAFARSYKQQISEIRRQLENGEFNPGLCQTIFVPKSHISMRPGSRLPLADRVVLYAIMRLFAKTLDAKLPPKNVVYSWRVKDIFEKKSIFVETDILDLPFLKKKTVAKYVDFFDPWYAAWPDFDNATRVALMEEKYAFLVTTDIAAYFENIDLGILRDMLSRDLNSESKIVNLVMRCLQSYTRRTGTGLTINRGIPQGNQFSSFLANYFLYQLDSEILKLSSADINYFRYMDDIRIFCQTEGVARRVALILDKSIRALHLNLQSSKTKILSNEDALAAIHDSRIDDVNVVIGKMEGMKKPYSPTFRKYVENALEKISREKPANSSKQSVYRARRPLDGLSLRVLRRLVTAHRMIGSSKMMDRLFKELERNPDYRLTRSFMGAARVFPRRNAFGKKIYEYLSSDLNVFDHQEAELLKSARYFSRLPTELREYAMVRALDVTTDPYIRLQASVLLSRYPIPKSSIDLAAKQIDKTGDATSKLALFFMCAQSTGKYNKRVVTVMANSLIREVSEIGKFLHDAQEDKAEAVKLLNFVFEKNRHMVICDFLPFLHFISCSTNEGVLTSLLARLAWAAKNHPCLEIRDSLQMVEQRAKAQIYKQSVSPA